MKHLKAVMVRCPTTGRSLATGIETDAATFNRLPDISSSVICPACGLEHTWSTSDAWLGEPPPSAPPFPWLF